MTFTDSVYANDTAKKMRKLTKVKKGIYGYTDTGEVKYATIDYADGGGNGTQISTDVLDSKTLNSSTDWTSERVTLNYTDIDDYDMLKIGLSSNGEDLVDEIEFGYDGELIGNGSFEFSADTNRNNWYLSDTTTISTEQSHTGTKSLKIVPIEIYGTKIPSHTNKTLRIYKNDDDNVGNANIFTGTYVITFWVYSLASQNITYTIGSKPSITATISELNKWVKVVGEIEIIEESASHNLIIYGGATDSVYIDDVSVQQKNVSKDDFSNKDWENAIYIDDSGNTYLKANTNTATKTTTKNAYHSFSVKHKGAGLSVKLLGIYSNNKSALNATNLNYITKDFDKIMKSSAISMKRNCTGTKVEEYIKW